MADDRERDSQMDSIANNIPELELIPVEPEKELTYNQAIWIDPDSINWDLIWKNK